MGSLEIVKPLSLLFEHVFEMLYGAVLRLKRGVLVVHNILVVAFLGTNGVSDFVKLVFHSAHVSSRGACVFLNSPWVRVRVALQMTFLILAIVILS